MATALWCPRCLGPVAAAEAACPRCGLGQQGADAARLRVVVRRLWEVGEQRKALEVESAALGSEQARLLRALDPVPPRARSRPLPEWRAEVVRSLLLGLGSVLVALAALIFAAVTWPRLGDLGRAGLLAAATLVVAGAAAAAHRRLPATGEALGGLALALLLVDWYALGRAGAGAGWPDPAWWAVGTAIAGAVATAAGRRLRVQRLAAAALFQVSALLTVVAVTDTTWTTGTGLALVAAVAAGAASRFGAGATRAGWRPVAVVLGVGAFALELAALGMAMGAAESAPPGLGGAAGPAVALAAMALGPAVARVLLGLRSGDWRADALVVASAGALLASAAMLLGAVWASWSLAAAVAVLGAGGVGVARVLPRSLRLGTTVAAGLTLAAGLAGLADPVLWALVGPTGWALDPWTADPVATAAAELRRVAPHTAGAGGPAVIIGLLAGATGVALAALPGRDPKVVPPLAAGAVALAAWVGSMAVLPLAFGWPLWAALTLTAAAAFLTGAAATLLDHRPTHPGHAPAPPPAGLHRPALMVAGAAAVLLVLAGGWALATEGGTLAHLGLLVPAAVIGAGFAVSPWLRRAWGAVAAAAAVAGSAVVAVHLGAEAELAGTVMAVAAGVVLVAGARWRRGSPEGPVVEVAALAGLALGVALAAADRQRLAVALTAATPVLLAAAGPGRRAYRWAGAVVAVTAIWAWLVVAGVTVLEAYTLPAAAGALGAGLAARNDRPRPGSWPAYGPGLALALLPSLAVAVDRGGPARPLLLTGGALLVVLAGARSRLQAPLVLGGATLVVLAVDAALPVAARLPRWTTIGGSGLLLLWLGATADRRLARLRQLGRRFQGLEPGAAGRG